jgi:DNA-binding transcriptional ArsR family regulator
VRACLHEARPAGELVLLTELGAASVSEHLKVLRKTGLLTMRADGRQRLYRADAATITEIAARLAALVGA